MAQEHGVVIVAKDLDDEIVDGIRSVKDETAVRQSARNAYYGLSRGHAWKHYGELEGRYRFLCARAGEEMVGLLHLVHCDNVAAILNLTVKRRQFDK